MLARARWLPKVRDNEARARYGRRPHAARDELGGKTLLIVGSDRSAAGSRGLPWRSTCA